MITVVQAQTVSAAWHDAVRAARAAERRKLYHLVVGVEDPLAEDQLVRREVDSLLAGRQLQKVDTVANTIMPEAMAETCNSHEELVRRYREAYPVIKRFTKNNWGTYFGRLIAYPLGHDKTPAPVDQLAPVIKNLSGERVLAAQHEVVVGTTEDLAEQAEVIDPGVIVHHPTRGRRGRGGPCLTNVAFQREANRVHAVAHYRSHYLVERAYGNYLGLGRLLRYVAGQAGLEAGHLTVVAGYAQIDGPMADVDRVLDRIVAARSPA